MSDSLSRLSPWKGRGLAAAGWMVVIVGAILIIREGKDLFIPLVIALIGVYLIKVMERWISSVKIFGRRIPEILSLILAFAAVIAFSFLLFSIIADNAVRVAQEAPRYQGRLLKLQYELFEQFGLAQPAPLMELIRDVNIAGVVAQIATNLAALLKTTTLILIFAVFLLLESRFIPEKIEALFPDPDRRKQVRKLIQRIDADIQTYFGVKTLISLLTALSSYIVMRVVNLDFAEFWALLVFILNFIPTVGSIIATIFPALMALVQFDDTWAPFIVLVVGITLIQQLFGSFIEPNLMGMTLNLSPLVVVMSLIIWGIIWGVVGMFLCVPMTVIMVIICANFPGTRWVALLLSKRGKIQL